METTGDVRALCEVVEENLLRIGQEALTNVIKHAGASEVRVSLDFGPQAVTLRVKDNGRGFTPDNCPGSREGHFGLLGISERAKRLNGQLLRDQHPGKRNLPRGPDPRPGNGNGAPPPPARRD